MTKIKKGGSSAKQLAYARLIMEGELESKHDMALAAGFSEHSAISVTHHIESKQGFRNAMLKVATEANDLLIAAMQEFRKRNFTDFSNTELVNALNTISAVSSKFNEVMVKTMEPQEEEETKGNKLRTVILQQIENQHNTTIKGRSTKKQPIIQVQENEAPEIEVPNEKDIKQTIQEQDF